LYLGINCCSLLLNCVPRYVILYLGM
jgi:hypothetical protein